MVLIIIFGENYQVFQIQLILLSSSTIVLYIGYYKPYNNAFSNRMELINEILIFFNTFFLVQYTDFIVTEHRDRDADVMVTDVDYKYDVGWYNVASLGCIFAFNIGVMLFFTIKDLISAVRSRMAKPK